MRMINKVLNTCLVFSNSADLYFCMHVQTACFVLVCCITLHRNIMRHTLLAATSGCTRPIHIQFISS